jgi:hypothetical protein
MIKRGRNTYCMQSLSTAFLRLSVLFTAVQLTQHQYPASVSLETRNFFTTLIIINCNQVIEAIDCDRFVCFSFQVLQRDSSIYQVDIRWVMISNSNLFNRTLVSLWNTCYSMLLVWRNTALTYVIPLKWVRSIIFQDYSRLILILLAVIKAKYKTAKDINTTDCGTKAHIHMLKTVQKSKIEDHVATPCRWGV